MQTGLYCKAYLLGDLRRFPGWAEAAENARPAEPGDGGPGAAPRALSDDDVVYLHDDHTVTDGIHPDRHVLFAGGGEVWERFCAERLGFAVPDASDAE